MRVGLIAVLAGAALFCAVPAQGAATKTVNIGDNYFTPDTLKVKRGTTVKWVWPDFETAGDVHDVKLVKPQGREEVPVRGGLDGLLVQAQAQGAGAVQARRARSTRRCA